MSAGFPAGCRTRSESPDTATLLVMCTPAGLEEAFQEAGWVGPVPPPADWKLTPQAIAHAMAKRDCQILEPHRGADDGPIDNGFTHLLGGLIVGSVMGLTGSTIGRWRLRSRVAS